MTAAMLVLPLVGLWFITQLRIWRIHPARTRRSVRRNLVDGPSLDHLVPQSGGLSTPILATSRSPLIGISMR